MSLTSVSQIKLATQTKPLTHCLAHSGHSGNICWLINEPESFLVLVLVSQWCPTLQLSGLHVAHQAPLSMEFSSQEYWTWVAIPLSRESS